MKELVANDLPSILSNHLVINIFLIFFMKCDLFTLKEKTKFIPPVEYS